MNPTERQVRAQIEAMRTDSFELLLLTFDEDSTKASLIENLSADQVFARIPLLRAKNAAGMNINIRPTGTHLSLLDDLSTADLTRLLHTGYEPCVVVETSPKNFQAWLDHGRVLSDDEATDFARQLAQIAKADLGAAGRRHAGRLAGFTNRKPKYRNDAGQFPFVRLTYANSRTFAKAAEMQLQEVQEPKPLPMPRTFPTRITTLLSIEQFHSDPRYNGDLSRADFAYAIYAHSHNISEQEIIENILKRDMRKKGNDVAQRRYAKYTSFRASKQVRK
ncbi:MAG: DNA-primase RepB domain-containing protein [Terracidiphilus sp.]